MIEPGTFECPACNAPNPLDSGGAPLLRACNKCGAGFPRSRHVIGLAVDIAEPFDTDRCDHYDASRGEVVGRIELVTIQAGRVRRAKLLLCEGCVENLRHWVALRRHAR